MEKNGVDYSGLREIPFRKMLMKELQEFVRRQNECYKNQLLPLFAKHGFRIVGMEDLAEEETADIEEYFERTVYPMLTPMLVRLYPCFSGFAGKSFDSGCDYTGERYNFGGRPKAVFCSASA